LRLKQGIAGKWIARELWRRAGRIMQPSSRPPHMVNGSTAQAIKGRKAVHKAVTAEPLADLQIDQKSMETPIGSRRW